MTPCGHASEGGASDTRCILLACAPCAAVWLWVRPSDIVNDTEHRDSLCGVWRMTADGIAVALTLWPPCKSCVV